MVRTDRAPDGVTRPSRAWWTLSVPIAVWLVWLVVGGSDAVAALRHNVDVAVTMVFGSLVGGGTSEGGGAVAFPVFTKVLGIPATEARTFTFAIQSIGMVAASIVILARRIPVERRVLLLGPPAGIAGVLVSTTLLAPLFSPTSVRVGFTVLLTGLAVSLIVQQCRRARGRNDAIPVFERREAVLVVATAALGGLVSGVAGTGENTVVFIALVLLFRVSEKVATPTTVVLMATVSVGAFFSHVVLIGDFHGAVVGYWLAAAPVVVAGAPLGALLCSRMPVAAIRWVLVGLIAVELVSTVLLVPMSTTTLVTGVVALVLCSVLCVGLTRVRRYDPQPAPAPAPAGSYPSA